VEYLHTHTTPGALRAGLANYYRAIAQDGADKEPRTGKVAMPTLAIGGGTSWVAAPRSPALCAQRPTASPRRSTRVPPLGAGGESVELAASLSSFIG
jgi:hypothetical protein